MVLVWWRVNFYSYIAREDYRCIEDRPVSSAESSRQETLDQGVERCCELDHGWGWFGVGASTLSSLGVAGVLSFPIDLDALSRPLNES